VKKERTREKVIKGALKAYQWNPIFISLSNNEPVGEKKRMVVVVAAVGWLCLRDVGGGMK
jgi:hypothetical protein